MGCSAQSSIREKTRAPQINQRREIPLPLNNVMPYLQSNQDINFNFPEVKEDIFVGKGLKKMKGYICPISKEDLDKKRISFWGTRVEGNEQSLDIFKENMWNE